MVHSRSKNRLVHNGFTYHINARSKTGERIYWTCSEIHRQLCKARCITVGNEVTLTNSHHTHPAQSHLGFPETQMYL